MVLLRAIRRISFPVHGFHNSSSQPDLDPALQALLKDADISLLLSKKKRKYRQVSFTENRFSPPPHRELEALSGPLESPGAHEDEENGDTHTLFPLTERKSPAASFGSRGIGAVVLPFELQRSILRLISESDKSLIHADAERLFHDSEASESKAEKSWSEKHMPTSWSMKYTPPAYTEPRSNSKFTHIKARLNRQRDGTAFATVVMPPQYAAVRAVLEGVKTRLGDDWTSSVKRIVEWGSGTGAGLWAALHTFQRSSPALSPMDHQKSTGQVSDVPAGETRSEHATSHLSDHDISGDAVTQSGSATLPVSVVSPRSTQSSSHDHNDWLFLNSTNVTAYIGIEKREGLASIARRLLRDVPLHTSISLQKTFHSTDRFPRSSEVGLGTVGLTAFMLNALKTPALRKDMLKEMWESGADVLVIIDDASAEGFKNVADAREFLLKLGRREVDVLTGKSGCNSLDGHDAVDAEVGSLVAQEPENKLGGYVVAPCPHDHACPLAVHQYLPSSGRNTGEIIPSGGDIVRCTFVQRLQRPTFVRHTKHVKRGEEDVGYAYVVVRRGERPRSTIESEASQGRVGAVGRWAGDTVNAKEVMVAEERAKKKKWVIDEAGVQAGVIAEEGDDISADVSGDKAILVDGLESESVAATEPTQDTDKESRGKLLEDALRNEAYGWPRINFPPLKRNGHVIIDACMPEGKIMRMTFPRSQGKQIYYDARKSKWGDLFPHAPKHRPVLRYSDLKAKASKPPSPYDTEEEDWMLSEQTSHLLGERDMFGKREKWISGRRGGEGGLAKTGLRSEGSTSSVHLMADLKAEQRERRRVRRQGREAQEEEYLREQ